MAEDNRIKIDKKHNFILGYENFYLKILKAVP